MSQCLATVTSLPFIKPNIHILDLELSTPSLDLELIVPLANMFFVQVSTWLTHSWASNICSHITFSAGSHPLQYSYLGNPMDRSSLASRSPCGVAKVRHDHRHHHHHHLISKVHPDQSIKTEATAHLPLYTDILSPSLAPYFS